MKVLLTAAVVAVTAGAVPGLSLHFGLARSVPAAGSTVSAPAEVTLWFTEVPQDNSISIRLVDARGELVAASDAREGAEDPRQFSIVPSGALAAGEYTVAWRGIGQDGHTVRGDFGFTVSSE
jgi:methionine-rich copper-binding protein CopC